MKVRAKCKLKPVTYGGLVESESTTNRIWNDILARVWSSIQTMNVKYWQWVMGPLRRLKPPAKLLTPIIMVALLLLIQAPRSHAMQMPPIVTGWGGSRLLESSRFSQSNPASEVFPGENASDMEMQALMLVQKGFNGYRASFAPYCTNPNGFFGTYNASQLHRSIEIAAHYGLWIIVDYHGNDDLQTDSGTLCWLNFWAGVVQQFMGSYDRIIWEPLNEPNATFNSTSILKVSSAYQQWVDEARSLMDNHWIVIENLCSYACGLPVANYWKAYPTVSDPAGRLFISLHAYFEYRYHYSEWSNATADTYARTWLLNLLNGTKNTGWPILNTEGGPGRPFGRLTNGTMVTCPDLILNGSSGYCTTNFRFIQTATTLLDNQVTVLQSRLNWLWFPMADWSSTPGAGIYGSLSSTGPGWGTILSYEKAPPLLNLTISATPNTLTIYPGSFKTSLIAVNSTGFEGVTNLTTIATPSGPIASPTNPTLQIVASGSNTTVLTITVPAGTAAGSYDVRVTGSAGILGSRAAIVKVIVRDFKLTADSEVAPVLARQGEVSHLDLEGLNNFNDSVILSVTSRPSVYNATIFPAIVAVRPGQTSTATLSFNSTTADIYILTIIGRSDGSSHSINVTVIVQDFKISVNSFNSQVLADSDQTLTLLVGGIDGFSGNVTVTASVFPHGPTVEVTPGVVILTPGGQGDASLIIHLPSNISTGSYTITVDAGGRGIHHQTVLRLDVTDPTSGPHSSSQVTILGLQLVEFVGLVSFVVAVGAVLAYKKLFFHR